MIGSKIPWMPPFTENVEADFRIDGASICAAGTITNRVAGVVHARHGGLVRAGVQIKVGERTNLRVKWPIEDERFFLDGQHVVATIPAEAVRLESGMFRRSKQRWNRWIGRIVFGGVRQNGGCLYSKNSRRGLDTQELWSCVGSTAAEQNLGPRQCSRGSTED